MNSTCKEHNYITIWRENDQPITMPFNDWYNIEKSFVNSKCTEECISKLISSCQATKKWADYQIDMLSSLKLGVEGYYPSDIKIAEYLGNRMSNEEKDRKILKYFKDIEILDQYIEKVMRSSYFITPRNATQELTNSP
ncbi:hypothetical protein DLAC_01035 [Tieghemostelium lacteum]|uniref:Uncharacterized protein n=1 Tax=Tieghemostelium lacteum TaxID=361077 RepID=A0A152A7W4_TIELA|nr:hypothetical protein DLAC_01035 [Tieghemostelium lacteum]|eukprot:KYR02215.1 hypothetical protein DLAC_01035 [Tieghemostelium lacteum]